MQNLLNCNLPGSFKKKATLFLALQLMICVFQVKWMSLMKTDKYVQTHYLTPEQYAKHFKLRKANDPGAFDNVL